MPAEKMAVLWRSNPQAEMPASPTVVATPGEAAADR